MYYLKLCIYLYTKYLLDHFLIQKRLCTILHSISFNSKLGVVFYIILLLLLKYKLLTSLYIVLIFRSINFDTVEYTKLGIVKII